MDIKIVEMSLGEISRSDSGLPMLEIKVKLNEDKKTCYYLMPFRGYKMQVCGDKKGQCDIASGMVIGLQNILLCTKGYKEKHNELFDKLGHWTPICSNHSYSSGEVAEVLFEALINETLLKCIDRVKIIAKREEGGKVVVDFNYDKKIVREFNEEVYKHITDICKD